MRPRDRCPLRLGLLAHSHTGLLLADRVTGLEAEAGVLGRGTIWTETDVEAGAWYLNIGEDPDAVKSREEIQRLASAVLRRSPGRQVLVAGDTSVDYGAIMQAMVTLQIAGAPEIGLVSEPN